MTARCRMLWVMRYASSKPVVSELIALLDRWRQRKVVVVGDVMLDHLVFGHAERLAPDAPVPVLNTVRHEYKPGGASNVCLDLRALHCKVELLSVMGDDLPGKQLRQSLQKAGVGTSGLMIEKHRPTTVKQNIIGLAQHRHPQKMFRVDSETREPISQQLAQQLLQKADKLLAKADALCIEDYNKGLLTPEVCRSLIQLARRHNVPVMVDPALIDDYAKYHGATVITPNRYEAGRAAGGRNFTGSLDADFSGLHHTARKLQKQLDLEAVVLTLDKHGCLLLDEQQKPLHVPTTAQQVYDVTGAGDMVLAMLTAARANGALWVEATHLANLAAGLEVQRFGCVPIELDEVLVALLAMQRQTQGKLRSLDELLPELKALRGQGKKIAFTNGCFDVLHAGHVAYLRQARQTADMLVLGLNSDSSIKRLKGPSRPVNQQSDRVLVMSELSCVDYVVVFDEDTPMKLIRAIKPDVLVKGADYKKHEVVGADMVEKLGGRVVLVPLVQGRSTTNILRKLESSA